MIIELSDEFAVLDAVGWNPYSDMLNHLLVAHASGWHIFTPSRQVSESISSHCDLSQRQKEFLLSSVTSRLATLIGQARSADFTLLVVPSGSTGVWHHANQIVVPAVAFAKMGNCLPTRLLVEDATYDGAYLVHVAKAAARELGYGLRLHVDLLHGGGSGLANRYSELLAEERPSVCIADSDVRFPGGVYGETAKGILAKGLANESGTVRAMILPVRELENTIPVSFLFEVYRNNPEVRARVSNFCKHIDDCRKSGAPDNMLSYLDFKEGDDITKIAQTPDPQKLDLIKACQRISLVNLPDSKFTNPKKGEKAHFGIAENLLRVTNEFLERSPHLDKLFVEKLKRTPFWAAIEQILRLILSFGAATAPLVSRPN